ncbi:MAG: cyanophycinase [Bacteroidota bacterium]|jgi:cyanophycinase|nr:cyanophycinase [Bacteroidota bacterium]
MKTIKPKGTLIPIGGGEDKEHKKTVLARVIEESKKIHPKVCVMMCATEIPREVASDYRKAFKSLGVTKLSFVHYDTRDEADSPKDIAKIKECDVVMFSGGNQLRLTSLLGGTELMQLIKQRYYDEPNFVVAGTSAGAAAMSSTMLLSGNSCDAMIKGELEMISGFDLMDFVLIDTHFTERGRFGRLIQTVTGNPVILGIGLGEDTCLIIKAAETMEVVGSGLVVIVDGKEIVYSNLAEVDHGTPVTVEGIKLNVLGPGEKFLINERTLIVKNGESK